MCIIKFQVSLNLIKRFVYKLHKENIPIMQQKLFIKEYADHLNLHLSNPMIEEVVSWRPMVIRNSQIILY